jgi:hypothetical protein
MRDHTKWNIAIARLAGFVSSLPRSPDEDQVLQYHDIIKLFEEAYEHDLSQFRIGPDRVKPKADNTTLASRAARWQTRHPKKSSVEFVYFHGQVRRLIDYLKAVLGSRPF